jgi:hypothetical protein
MPSSLRRCLCISILVAFFLLAPALHPQDASTGAIRGVVLDPDARPVPAATIAVVNAATGTPRSAVTDADGRFAVELLPPGDYSARAEIKGMSPQVTPQIHVEVGRRRS